MKLLRFAWGDHAAHGVLVGDVVHPLLGDLFAQPQVGKEQLPLASLRLLAPIAPSKVIAVGINYPPPGQVGKPSGVLSIKASSAVIGPDEPILLPADIGEVIGEVELGVVIGRRATRIRAEDADAHILGYTCINDVMARALWMKEGRKLFTKCKSFDTFCPMGPCIETELARDAVRLQMRRNGTLIHDGNTQDMIVKIPDLVSQISHTMTLLPGDVISTGGPHWPEAGTDLPSSLALRANDEIELEIEGIGVLRNRVVNLADVPGHQ